MAKLVEDLEIYNYLDVDESDDDASVLLAIRDSIEELLEQQTSQTFGPVASVIDEVLDGTGASIIFVRRPIAAIVEIKFRYLPETVDEQFYNVDVTDGITFRTGTRRIYSRTLCFPEGRDNVLISYTAAANQPFIAKGAVREATAAIWRGKGSEDARSEQKGTFQHVLIRKLDELKFWSKAVESLQVPLIG